MRAEQFFGASSQAAIQVRAQDTIDHFGRAADTHDPLQQREQLLSQCLGGRLRPDRICQPLFGFHER
jgi:hypothetical protein